MRGVFGIAPKRGWKGSRGWKSIGPFLTCTSTFGRNCPSRGWNSANACFARSSGTSFEYTNARHITTPPWGATASASTFAPAAWERP